LEAALPFKEIVSTTSETVAAIREIAIIGLVVVFLFNQHFVARYMADYARTLADAGKDKGATKTEAKTPLADYTFEATQEALTTSSSANSTISHSLEQLEKIKASVKSPQVAAQIEAVTSNMLSAQKAVTQSIKVTQDLQLQAATNSPYGIAVAADRLQEHATNEVQLLKKNRFVNISVYMRQGLYITVARFTDRDSAKNELLAVHVFRPDAYLVNIDSFCQNQSPSSEKIDTVNVTDCK
jgi:hypothetical protein